MNKIYQVFFIIFFCLAIQGADGATWEKLYVKRSTDCFRSVREVPAGGFVLAGYTSDLTPHDTDGLVLRLNSNGDTLWSFVYNGPSSKEDCFYKVVPTSDGGFILCGYSKSFGNGENAIYAKLNSSGSLQWIKNWGGSGIERAQDIIQLSDGKYVLCGYTTTAPAHYYDAFILKIDGSGNTLWSKIYGGTNYDDANSLKVLPDDGFILGGQSNNQLFLIRTDSEGDSLWTKAWGTSGIENIECVNFAQGGNGFILAGTTDGTGNGGEDAYVVKTDTGGVQQWAKTIGGSDNDGFHRIEQTSDGGYFAVGTSSEGPWPDPNIWLVKMDGNGNKSWETFYGGDNHDHGYSGQPTSDGGYIACGHTHSFVSNDNAEDAYVIKTNSTGQVTAQLSWTTVTELLTPLDNVCGVANTEIKIEVTNYGLSSITSVPVTIEITGAINQTISQTFTTSIAHDASKTLTLTTNVDMTLGGNYHFHCYTGNPHDVLPPNNFLDEDITSIVTSSPPGVTNGSHCGPSTVNLSATSPDQIKWYAAATGGSSLSTGASFTTPFITGNTTYYAQAGSTCPSTRVAVSATITPGITPPTVTNGSRCGNGTVNLSANSASPIKWYSSSTSTSSLQTGTSYTTSSLSSSSTYYVASDNGTCTSTRVAVQAVVNTPPDDPIPVTGFTCGNGVVHLSATAGSQVLWFAGASGGSQLASGNNFNTPSISNTITYYVQADDGTCLSNRVPVIATVATPPMSPVVTSSDRCGSGTIDLLATSVDSIRWYDAASGGNLLGNGNSFTTPAISTTTTYYASSFDGTCPSARIPATATVNPLPASPVTTTAERCGDGTITLTATAADPITWFDAATGGNQVGTGNSFTTPSLSATTTYYAQSNDGLCSSNAIACDAVVNPNPVVNIGTDTVFSSASTYQFDAGSGFAGYLWSPNDLTQFYTAHTSGIYCVTVTDAKNCSTTECVYLELPLKVNDQLNESFFNHYPEPSHGFVTIEFPKFISNVDLNILDITGKVVFVSALSKKKEVLDLTFLTPGIYILRLLDGRSSYAQRLIIE